MHPFPHHYTVEAAAADAGAVSLRVEGAPEILSTPPPEFDGPPGHWSPESLFVSSIADCFVLSFRAIARASSFAWQDIACSAVGTLDRTSEGLRFTRIDLQVTLKVPAGGNAERAQRLLEKAEKACLVSNSIKSEMHLHAEVSVG